MATKPDGRKRASGKQREQEVQKKKWAAAGTGMNPIRNSSKQRRVLSDCGTLFSPAASWERRSAADSIQRGVKSSTNSDNATNRQRLPHSLLPSLTGCPITANASDSTVYLLALFTGRAVDIRDEQREAGGPSDSPTEGQPLEGMA